MQRRDENGVGEDDGRRFLFNRNDIFQMDDKLHAEAPGHCSCPEREAQNRLALVTHPKMLE